MATGAVASPVSRRLKMESADDLPTTHGPPETSHGGMALLYEKGLLRDGPTTFHERFLQAVQPHIASYDTFLDFFIPEIVKDLSPVYIDPSYDRFKHELDPFYTSSEYLKVYIRRVTVGRPVRIGAEHQKLFPRECRNGHSTYGAPLLVEFVHDNCAQKNPLSIVKRCGTIPIMVRSNRCHLHGLSPAEMVAQGEDCNELGGYFIINGNERVIRFVVQQRCNYPISLRKSRFAERDLFFTEFAVLMRCAKRDGTSTANILFYTEDRQCAFRVLINRQEVVVPFWILLRALMPTISMDLIKKKIFETQFDFSASSTKEKGNEVMDILEMEALWKDFVEQETLFCDIDKGEDRYLHQLGKLYWDSVGLRLKPGARYEDAGRYVISKYVLVHCESWTAKFEALLLMKRKLLALVRGNVTAENIDSFAYQEVITPGHLFASVLKDALYSALARIRLSYAAELHVAQQTGEDPRKVIRSREQFDLILRRTIREISYSLNYFMATGNIRTSQLDLQQLSGWTVVADRLNVNRFLSHFRAVHRGQFFAQMRTTEVRKLLGETWGFLCPVHTPDGGPCGLLLHLAQDAVPVTDPPDGKALAALKVYLHRRGIPVDLTGHTLTPPVTTSGQYFPLVFDGEPICRLPLKDFHYWIQEIQRLKRETNPVSGFLPQHLELAAFERGSGAFEGIFLFSFPGRLARPVRHIASGSIEWIGPLAQPWLNIACLDSEVEESKALLSTEAKLVRQFVDRPDGASTPKGMLFREFVESFREQRGRNLNEVSGTCNTLVKKEEGLDESNSGIVAVTSNKNERDRLHCASLQTVPIQYSHVEITPTAMLSITSALTPFSDHNQSPRNMYQCQMLKQTMGTPFHAIPCRTDNKAYRLLFPQVPCVRTQEYRAYQFDEYPSGTNAVVAVISHTGFDMEDAMILNKASVERGAFHGVVYKTKIIESAPPSARGSEARSYIFCNHTSDRKPIVPELGLDGLPPVGTMLKKNSPFYRTITRDALASDATARSAGHITTYHDDEVAYVDKINWIGVPEHQKGESVRAGVKGSAVQKVSIRLRCVRNPIVGDKFASRAGQKGILSMLWPQEDMPFTASGIVPDIVFNPHGFPSRMTVGMLIESMAGKSAAIHGSFQDCTPFRTFPRQERCGIPWIDQGSFNGWVKRGERYATKEEDEQQTTDSSIDYFGKALLRAGYQYYGSEPLYSGIHGAEMDCHIFMGVIYYQRLRHMVSDKWQVRSTGPIDALTRQPVKGRKRGGGVRFGEMERDALLAHGTSCLLQDRLMHCSDEHKAFVCPSCGSVLAPCLNLSSAKPTSVGGKKPVARCRVCDVPCRLVSLPFVFRYISNELAAMNVIIRLQLTERDHVLKGTKRLPMLKSHSTELSKDEFKVSSDVRGASKCKAESGQEQRAAEEADFLFYK